MRRKTKKLLISLLSCGLLTSAAFGASVGTAMSANAETVRVKPTGWYSGTLTQEIKDSEYHMFTKMYDILIEAFSPKK